jgi:hypothetical protein
MGCLRGSREYDIIGNNRNRKEAVTMGNEESAQRNEPLGQVIGVVLRKLRETEVVLAAIGEMIGGEGRGKYGSTREELTEEAGYIARRHGGGHEYLAGVLGVRVEDVEEWLAPRGDSPPAPLRRLLRAYYELERERQGKPV